MRDRIGECQEKLETGLKGTEEKKGGTLIKRQKNCVEARKG